MDGKSVSKKAFLVMIRLACGALFWPFTKIRMMGRKQGGGLSFIFIYLFFLFLFPNSLDSLFQTII